MRIDHGRENRVCVSEEPARSGIGDGRGGHAFSRRSVSTISITSANVSSRAQSR